MKMKIYDYTRIMKDSYFIQEGWRVVLVDLGQKTIQVSKCSLSIFFLLSHHQCVYVKDNSPLYKEVLARYYDMLGALVIPNKYKKGLLFKD
ncbi:hypothetical protein C900_00504 [Fulvivirga imtechensis AK7]|uniref:Uncharacterized protein n=1 Tax=Fulvivirga imtechensis AK7 TaxID=1237149 RepID=L8K0J8_9BACT|nr:hypothetical protein [Fulvivirga imtechensis]ELR73002.1 hypothetical protein C900_00504 [Fulvivirga imtechensis AK7]